MSRKKEEEERTMIKPRGRGVKDKDRWIDNGGKCVP